jgi:hypothetical protein
VTIMSGEGRARNINFLRALPSPKSIFFSMLLASVVAPYSAWVMCAQPSCSLYPKYVERNDIRSWCHYKRILAPAFNTQWEKLCWWLNGREKRAIALLVTFLNEATPHYHDLITNCRLLSNMFQLWKVYLNLTEREEQKAEKNCAVKKFITLYLRQILLSLCLIN